MKSTAGSILTKAALLTASIAVSASAYATPQAVQENAPVDVAETKAEDAPKRMTPELLWKLGRLGEAAVSPDGSQIVYTVRRYKLADDAGKSSLHLRNLSSGKDTVIVENWSSIGNIQWAKTGGGDRVFFIGLNGADEEPAEEEATEKAEGDVDTEIVEIEEAPQCWSLNVESGDTLQVTSLEDGIANLKVAPGGSHIAFTRDIKMDKEVTELYEDLPKADARIIDGLMYRHWNAWHDFKYSHLHVATIAEDGRAGEPTDLMKDIKADCPVPPFGGSEQINWSVDGKEIAYTIKNDPKWAESTNSDVYVVPIDGSSPAKNISKGMPGYDNEPVYSPDGKYIAFHSMERASFESDRNRIMVYDRQQGSIRDITSGLDQTAHGSVWAPDSKSIIFASETKGTNQLYRVSLDSPGAVAVSKGRYNWSVIDILPNGESLLASRMDMLRPKELAVIKLADATETIVSNINDEIYESLELPVIEERWVDATDGKKIHCWVIHPPGFDASSPTKWPMLTYCQGGPQGQIGQWFSYRWNFHLMASQGYVIVAPNRRGLPGFGREWNDQISGDWGGQAMQDILSATDEMTKEPYIDKKKCAAIGASFGGYTVYWLMGNHRDRFCSMIAHCGVFNLESMYGSTEELFFVNWDLGGPYWKSDKIQDDYNKFSPHKFAGKWKTPLLVIHGQKDFRVPVTQGMEAFQVAQVKGVPSRFLYYPNEGHWVMKPQNGVLWHRVFFDWLDRYCKSDEAADSKMP